MASSSPLSRRPGISDALVAARLAAAGVKVLILEAGPRVANAMRAHPDLVRGPAATDTRLMKALPGWIAKGGAEGLLCAAGDGIGVALKSEDGSGRGLGPAAHEFLRRLGRHLDDLAELPIDNSRGERVGQIVGSG